MRMGWVAGLIEGEGWIGIRRKTAPVVQIGMVDLDVIRRLRDWSGVGTVRQRSRRTVTGKRVFYWTVYKRDDAGALLETLLPLFGERRSKAAAAAIEAWKSVDTLGTSPTCARGHELAGANLRLSDGRRRCRKCIAARARGYRARDREALQAA